MKALLFIGLVILGLNATAQEEIKWYSIEEAVQLARQARSCRTA